MFKIVLLFLVGEFFNFIRYFLLHTKSLSMYSIIFSLIQGIFVTSAEYLLLQKIFKKLVKNKVLLAALIFKSVVFFILYCSEIINSYDYGG